MSDAAFLDAIFANPSEDGPRLVYADWLEERGDPRGEFIRTQCELARLPEDDPKRPRLAAREKKLFKRHGRDWAGPALRTAFRWHFRRGFLHWVDARPDQFLAHGADWFAAAPTLETLTFLDAGGRVGEVVGSPILERLFWLGFSFTSDFPTGDPYGGLPGSTDPPPRFDNYLHLGDLQALAGSSHLTRLRGLSLTDARTGPAGFAALLLAPWPEQLTQLELSGNTLGDLAVTALADSPRFGNLMWLDLSHNGIGPDGAAALAWSERLPNLTRLDLSRNRIGGTLREALGRRLARFWSGPPGVTPGAGALSDSPHLRRLERLDLRRNRLTRADAELLSTTFGPRVRL